MHTSSQTDSFYCVSYYKPSEVIIHWLISKSFSDIKSTLLCEKAEGRKKQKNCNKFAELIDLFL